MGTWQPGRTAGTRQITIQYFQVKVPYRSSKLGPWLLESAVAQAAVNGKTRRVNREQLVYHGSTLEVVIVLTTLLMRRNV